MLVRVHHTEAEEAIIGIPTSACQPALSPLVTVRVDKESAERFQSHIPSLFPRPVTRKRRDVCVCVCVLWISVLLHNKSLLNKCKADGTAVSPPFGEKEREEEGETEEERDREREKTDAYSPPPQTHRSATSHTR